MKPIPKELQSYFPKAADPARPWWKTGAFSNGIPTLPEWQRHGEACFFSDLVAVSRMHIDKTDPLPPPPILVGQVWAQPNNDGGMRAAQVSAVTYESDGTVTVHWVSGHVATDDTWLYLRGFLLRGDYAPWSGPEVAP